jgi:hypothetical protein
VRHRAHLIQGKKKNKTWFIFVFFAARWTRQKQMADLGLFEKKLTLLEHEIENLGSENKNKPPKYTLTVYSKAFFVCNVSKAVNLLLRPPEPVGARAWTHINDRPFFRAGVIIRDRAVEINESQRNICNLAVFSPDVLSGLDKYFLINLDFVAFVGVRKLVHARVLWTLVAATLRVAIQKRSHGATGLMV